MTFGGPGLDDLASRIPTSLHHALADTTAESCLADHLLLVESGVELGHHDVAVLTGISANLLELFFCFYF